MSVFEKKSNLKYLAHNPTGELIKLLSDKIKSNKKSHGQSNKKTGGKIS